MNKNSKKEYATINNTNYDDLINVFTEINERYKRWRTEEEKKEKYNAYMRAYKKSHPRRRTKNKKKKQYRKVDHRLKVWRRPTEHSKWKRTKYNKKTTED